MITDDSKLQEAKQPVVEKKADPKQDDASLNQVRKRPIEEVDKDIKEQNQQSKDVNVAATDLSQKDVQKEELKLDPTEKTLHNTDASGATKNVSDIVFWGNGDTFKLISKASSKKEGWMKSSKAMEIAGLGCVLQVTTQQGQNVAEAVTFIPGTSIHEVFNEEGVCTSRMLVYLPVAR